MTVWHMCERCHESHARKSEAEECCGVETSRWVEGMYPEHPDPVGALQAAAKAHGFRVLDATYGNDACPSVYLDRGGRVWAQVYYPAEGWDLEPGDVEPYAVMLTDEYAEHDGDGWEVSDPDAVLAKVLRHVAKN